MAVIELLEQAEGAGVRLVLDGSRVGLRGCPLAVKEWAERLRPRRDEVLAEMQRRMSGVHVYWIVRPPFREAFAISVFGGATLEEVRSVWHDAEVRPQDWSQA